MKRIIAMALLLLMVLGVLTSCAKDTDTDDTENNTKGTAQVANDGLPNVDMDGFELDIITYNDEWFNWAEITMDVEKYEANVISEAIFTRNVSIEERFNCYLNITEQTSIDKNYIENLALSGDTTSGLDIIMYYDKWVIGSAAYFRDWDDVDYIDLSQEYWNPGITQMFDINGKQIAVSGVFSLGMLSRVETMLFNKEMYNNYFGTDVSMYDYVKNNDWTLERLYQLAQVVVSSTDEVWDDNDQYGISASKKELYTSLMIGSGVRFIEQDDKGEPQFTLTTNVSTVDKLQKLLQLNQNNQIHYDNSENAHYADPEQFFEKGHTLFGVRPLFDIPSARATMNSSFGILPIPKYDSEQEEYYSACFGGDVACMINTVKDEDLEYIGILMEAMAYDSQQNLIPKYKTDLLQTRYASDMESYEMLDIVFETAYSDMGITVLEDTVSMYLINAVFLHETDVISSELQTMDMAIPARLEQLFANIE